jgi:hypothetical protein
VSNDINKIILKDNGTVYGYYSLNDEPNIGAPLSREICTSFNTSGVTLNYDESLCKCLWKDLSCNNDYLKLIFNPNDNDGEVFVVNEGDNCTLEIQFDYLLEFNSENILPLINSLVAFTGLSLSATIESVEPNPIDENVIYESLNTLSTIYTNNFLLINDFGDYLSGKTDTGLRLVGDNTGETVNKIVTDLGNKGNVVTENTFKSCWLTFNINISDSDVLNNIANKKIKLGIAINNIGVDFSLLIDKIIMNRVCQHIDRVDKQILKCPGFNLERVIDNRKSWSYTASTEERKYDLLSRETNYTAPDDKLIINTKELDLEVDPALAIEENVLSYIKSSGDCLLTGDTVDLNSLLNTTVVDITSTDEFTKILKTELIDVKNRQTIQSYPTLRYLYDKYMNSTDYGCPNSGKFKYDELIKYSKALGTYWTDIIEQLIPATTIWGSSYIYRNNVFDESKFRYKDYTLFTCTDPSLDGQGPIIASKTSSDNFVKYYENGVETISCNNLFIVEINSGAEFRGSVIITGPNGTNNNSGGNISLISN